MSANWVFRELSRGDKDRQPTQGEFFSSDAIDSLAKALVRESIQNSLDAASKRSDGRVRVRFHVGSVSDTTAQLYFHGGWSHFSAPNNGLDDAPIQTDPCRYLIVEDFGTTGLIGDIQQYRHMREVSNPFYYFFRTVGRSGKNANERGRWGIGKYVFPRSSRMRTFIALTVREDDEQRLLMGQSVLKSHAIGEKYYTPDGNYGLDDENLIIPDADTVFIEQFAIDFNSKRGKEPGLSVMVPWVDEEITREAILKAVIEDYFFPIISGELSVIISDDENEAVVTDQNLETLARELDEDFADHIHPLIMLARWAKTVGEESVFRLKPAPSDKPKWDSTLVPADKLDELREKYRSGQRIAVSFPLTARRKGHAPEETYFRAYLVNDGTEQGRPVFIRDGIIIPGVKDLAVTGCRSIVLIEDSPLVKLLGDSENPAHTEWQKDSEHFRNQYYFPKMYIEFVTYAVSRFVRALNESNEQPNLELLQDIFFIPKKPVTDEPKDKSRPRKRNKGEVIAPDPKPEPTLKRFQLSRIAGGFTIAQGAKGAVLPDALSIVVAYDRQRGSALKNYSQLDFVLGKAPILIDTEDATVVEIRENRLLVTPTTDDFKIKVTGFDENRDLFINVRAKEVENDQKV